MVNLDRVRTEASGRLRSLTCRFRIVRTLGVNRCPARADGCAARSGWPSTICSTGTRCRRRRRSWWLVRDGLCDSRDHAADDVAGSVRLRGAGVEPGDDRLDDQRGNEMGGPAAGGVLGYLRCRYGSAVSRMAMRSQSLCRRNSGARDGGRHNTLRLTRFPRRALTETQPRAGRNLSWPRELFD